MRGERGKAGGGVGAGGGVLGGRARAASQVCLDAAEAPGCAGALPGSRGAGREGWRGRRRLCTRSS